MSLLVRLHKLYTKKFEILFDFIREKNLKLELTNIELLLKNYQNDKKNFFLNKLSSYILTYKMKIFKAYILIFELITLANFISR